MVIQENSGVQPPESGETGGTRKGPGCSRSRGPPPLPAARLPVELTPAFPLWLGPVSAPSSSLLVPVSSPSPNKTLWHQQVLFSDKMGTKCELVLGIVKAAPKWAIPPPRGRHISFPKMMVNQKPESVKYPCDLTL